MIRNFRSYLRYRVGIFSCQPPVRLFSVTGQVVTTTRIRLYPEMVTLLVFLHETLPVHHEINFQRYLGTMKMDEVVEIPGD